MGATYILAGICVIAFILQKSFSWITANFALISEKVLTNPWILITSMFLHGDIAHLLYNLLALVLFGMVLENIIGKKKFLFVFFISGLLASIGSSLMYDASLGASGAIFGILGTLTVLRPKMQVFIGFMPMPMFVAAVFWVIGDLVGLFIPSGVANLAHLVGLASGLGFGYFLADKFKERADGRAIYNSEEYEINDKDVDDWEKKWMK